MTLILKENSKEIREKIAEAGIKLCICASFVDSCWLDYSPGVTDEVHGIGYYGEEVGTCSQEDACARFLLYCKEPVFCDGVDEFIKTIKENRNHEQGC